MVAQRLLILGLWAVSAWASEPAPAYRLTNVSHPKDLTLEVSGMATLPDAKLAVAIRRGEIWIAENPYAPEGTEVKWKRFASGLHEPLGLALHEGAFYTTQRSEVTKIRDTDGDGVADEYTCAAKGWGVSGNYHEYAYGPKFDPTGNLWVTLNCSMGAGPLKEQVEWRGYSLRAKPDGSWKVVSGGMRSPCGIGINALGDAFYTDQQGNWNSGGSVHHMRDGAFHGHQESFKSAGLSGAPFAKPAEPVQRALLADAVKQMPIYTPPAVWLPYRKMGMSATDLTLVDAKGKFGPFEQQFLVGEFTMSQVNRVFLEKVQGQYQGACFPFLEGFQCGVLRMEFGQDGSLFVGQTNRGWNSFGNRSYGLQRVIWSGRTPMEIRTMEAQPRGFRCTFTQPVTPEGVAAAQWKLHSYTYEYHPEYGGQELENQELTVKVAGVSADGLAVDLEVSPLREYFIHELSIEGLKSQQGESVEHPIAYYTLNKIPLP